MKLLTYKLLIRHRLECLSPIWHLHQTYLANGVEPLKSQTASFVHSDYSFTTSATLKLISELLNLSTHIASLCLSDNEFHSSLNHPDTYLHFHAYPTTLHILLILYGHLLEPLCLMVLSSNSYRLEWLFSRRCCRHLPIGVCDHCAWPQNQYHIQNCNHLHIIPALM